MGTSWGTNLSVEAPQKMTASGDITGTAGSEVSCLGIGGTTSPTAASAETPGKYQPRIDGVLTVLLGATAPSALVIGYLTGAGADEDTYTVEPGLLVNSAELVLPVHLLGTASASAWIGSGGTPHVTVKATGQNVTVKAVGSRAIFQLVRVPD